MECGTQKAVFGRIAVDAGFTSRALKDGTAYLETNAIYDGGVFRGYRNESLPQSIFQVTNKRVELAGRARARADRHEAD